MSAPFVTRGGEKLAAALDGFHFDVTHLICADLGSHIGGFVDCLLQRGAARVYSVDTAYGILAWKLRKDPRVVVRERTNAMHVELPEKVDLVTADLGWTKQVNFLPRASALLNSAGRCISLIKPHYEADRSNLVDGVLPEHRLDEVIAAVFQQIARIGWQVLAHLPSPLLGHGGNREILALLTPAAPQASRRL